MKRGIHKPEPSVGSRRVALREVRGGASMVEYALLAVSHRIPMIVTPEKP